MTGDDVKKLRGYNCWGKYDGGILVSMLEDASRSGGSRGVLRESPDLEGREGSAYVIKIKCENIIITPCLVSGMRLVSEVASYRLNRQWGKVCIGRENRLGSDLLNTLKLKRSSSFKCALVCPRALSN